MASPLVSEQHGTLAVSYDDVAAAAARLDGIANRTPVMTSRTLDARVGASVFCKCENFQRAGAFKFRGAYNALSQLSSAQQQRGVLTYSSGNHAQAVALAGRLLGIPTTIIMPDDAPAVKLAATRGYDAEVILYNRQEITREALARQLGQERGLPLIPPYDHPHIVAGKGTAAKEFFEETGTIDSCRVVGVEPAQADDATRSFHSGRLHTVHNPDTIADGARTPSLGTITFPLVLHYVDDMVTVSDEAIRRAMHFLWERMKLVVEPTGALAVAALLDQAVVAPDARIGLLISGGNVDLRRALTLFKDV